MVNESDGFVECDFHVASTHLDSMRTGTHKFKLTLSWRPLREEASVGNIHRKDPLARLAIPLVLVRPMASQAATVSKLGFLITPRTRQSPRRSMCFRLLPHYFAKNGQIKASFR